MNDHRKTLLALQFGIYTVESAILTGILWFAAVGSPEFALGPLGRLLVAAALPLPCHLIWLMHVAWQGRTLRVPALPRVEQLRPLPVLRRS